MKRRAPEEFEDDAPLFAWARKTDPNTSKAAAASLSPKALRRLDARILDGLLEVDEEGATTLELSELLGIPRVSVSPRMKPLSEAGLVYDTGERRCGSNGRSSIVWRRA